MNATTKNERRRWPSLDQCVETIIINRADTIRKKNPDSLIDEDDIGNRMAERFMAKFRYFDPRRGKLEQFANKICSNVEAEMLPKIIADQQFRRATEYLDKPITNQDGETFTVADKIFATSSDHRLNTLRWDVRESVEEMPDETKEIAKGMLAGYSEREMAELYGIPRSTYRYRDLKETRKDFSEKFFGPPSAKTSVMRK